MTGICLQTARYRFQRSALLQTDRGTCRQHSVARVRRGPAATARSWKPDHTKHPIGGTHKGHHCQEGVRIWPGGYVLPSGLG